MNYYISDLHIGHKNAISFDNRPYNNVYEMDEDIIRRWNSVVKDEDTVYVLGDMFWCKIPEAIKILDRLKGKKVLIKGNHDRVHDSKFREKFEKITEYLEVDDNGRKVVLCHYPIVCFKNHYYGWYHLYGHVHSSFEWNMMENAKRQMNELYKKDCNMYNCGAMLDYMNFTPRTLDEIINKNKKFHIDNQYSYML